MKIEYFVLFIVILLIAACSETSKKRDDVKSTESVESVNSVAQTPPMGWNSYNAFGATVRESEVKENADFMAKNLKNLGWQYVVVDYCWFYPHHPKSNQDNPPQFRLPKDGSYVPWLAMDQFGRLLPDAGKFPSAEGGKGFKPLADYIHSLGLKFGIHVMRGIPRQAVWEKSPIKGLEGIDASMIADTASTCNWLNNMYGLDMSKKGAQEYYNSLFQLYASWDVDFVKVDDINAGTGEARYRSEEAKAYRIAIEQCGRPMVLSFSAGLNIKNADHLSETANMWRITNDFWDNWKQLYEMFEYTNMWTPYRKTGTWPDCDMMLLGRLSRRGPVGNERESNFTKNEQLTHVTLWSIAKSPLMFGGDLRVIDPFTLSLISNDEIIAVNQSATDAHQLYQKDSLVVWTSKMPDGATNLALFNLTDETKEISVDFKSIGTQDKLKIRDLWQKKDIGEFTGIYSQSVPAHGAVMVRCNNY